MYTATKGTKQGNKLQGCLQLWNQQARKQDVIKQANKKGKKQAGRLQECVQQRKQENKHAN